MFNPCVGWDARLKQRASTRARSNFDLSPLWGRWTRVASEASEPLLYTARAERRVDCRVIGTWDDRIDAEDVGPVGVHATATSVRQ